jgi:tryptophan-rich sensory protein
MPNTVENWYSGLKKPNWAPPNWVFGPVWSFLYILIFISFGSVFVKFFNGEFSFLKLLPFVINLLSNFLFTPIQFVFRNLNLALLDILIVLGSLIWIIVFIYPLYPWIAYMQIPYLIWLCIATTLQISIIVLNKK